jgi:hypothetical protein
MFNKKFIFLTLSAIFLNSLLAKPISLQLFTKNEGGVLKKVAIIGDAHMWGFDETPALNAVKMALFTDYKDRKPVTILTETERILVDEMIRDQDEEKSPYFLRLYNLPKRDTFSLQHATEFRCPYFRFLQKYLYQQQRANNLCHLEKPTNLEKSSKEFCDKLLETEQQLLQLTPTNPGFFLAKHKKLQEENARHITVLHYTNDCINTQEKTLRLIRMLEELTDYLERFADTAFLAKIMTDQQHNDRTVLFCGGQHAINLQRDLELLGYSREVSDGAITMDKAKEFISLEKIKTNNPIPNYDLARFLLHIIR